MTSVTNSGAILTGATGIGLIATKVDILTAIVFLCFFALIHGFIRWHLARKSENTEFCYVDFFLASVISLGSGVGFMLMGILAGRDELWIYMFGIIGSLMGIKGIDFLIDVFSGKVKLDINGKKNER